MSKRRKFTDEFKQEAVRLTEGPGVNCSQIARDIGIVSDMLAPKRHDMSNDNQRVFPKSPSPPAGEEGRSMCPSVSVHSAEVAYT